jgi:hypothetical protein
MLSQTDFAPAANFLGQKSESHFLVIYIEAGLIFNNFDSEDMGWFLKIEIPWTNHYPVLTRMITTMFRNYRGPLTIMENKTFIRKTSTISANDKCTTPAWKCTGNFSS